VIGAVHELRLRQTLSGDGCDLPSMGSVGDAYENATAESFFATLEREVLQRRTFKTRLKPACRCSNGSKVGTARIGVIRPNATSHQATSKGDN
jgi:hypothetical protein